MIRKNFSTHDAFSAMIHTKHCGVDPAEGGVECRLYVAHDVVDAPQG